MPSRSTSPPSLWASTQNASTTAPSIKVHTSSARSGWSSASPWRAADAGRRGWGRAVRSVTRSSNGWKVVRRPEAAQETTTVRYLLAFLLLCPVVLVTATAAAPSTSPAVQKLIDQLGDEDADVHKAAEKKL